MVIDTNEVKELVGHKGSDISINENISVEDVTAESVERTVKGIENDLKKATVDPMDDEKPEPEPRLSVNEVNDKIMGLIYGCVLGEIMGLSNSTMSENSRWGFSIDQLILTMGTLVETGMIHVSTFLQKFQGYSKKGMLDLGDGHNNIDAYTKEVVGPYEALSDPAKVSFEQFEKHNTLRAKGEECLSTCDNTPLIRCVMVGLYDDWDSYSFAATMATHADHRCISAGVIIAAATRNMLIGRPTNVSEIVTDTAAMVLSMKKMTSQRDINEYIRFTSEGYCTDLQLLNLDGGNEKHVYKCMAQSMYSLGDMAHTRNEQITLPPSELFKVFTKKIYNQGGDRAANCALSGAMMGCEIGYENLPDEWLRVLNPEHRTVLNNDVVNYLQHLGLVKPDEKDFDNILKEEELKPPEEPHEHVKNEEHTNNPGLEELEVTVV
jgi:ADP-ribosylglycohydrolase